MSGVKPGRAGADEYCVCMGGGLFFFSDGGGVFNLLVCMHKQNAADYQEAGVNKANQRYSTQCHYSGFLLCSSPSDL